MPRRALRRCSTPGCPGILENPAQRSCVTCARRADAARIDHHRYSSAAWRRRRASFLARHPRCVDCGAPATIADHAPVARRVLVARGVADPDAERWLQARCKPCHQRRTVRDEGALRRR
jgi:5-methylcytosine-specific restriction protein A